MAAAIGRTFTLEELQEAIRESSGFCIECGATAYGIEPDAREYPCEGCGCKAVYGGEELLIMGRVRSDD